jgi:hypothetical protein
MLFFELLQSDGRGEASRASPDNDKVILLDVSRSLPQLLAVWQGLLGALLK